MWIDQITRQVSMGTSRRNALRLGLGASVAALAHRYLASASDQDGTPVNIERSDSDPVFMFVQTATSGSFTAIPHSATPLSEVIVGDQDHTEFNLTLYGHNGQTVYFSDRPDRITGTATTESILETLGFTPVNPPNAALVASGEDGVSTVAVVELIDADFDPESDTLAYRAILLEDFTEFEGEALEGLTRDYEVDQTSRDFNEASLFIDDCADLQGCWVRVSSNEVQFLAPVPGYPNGIGMCFHLWPLGCLPCGTDDPIGQMEAYTQMCKDAYGSLGCGTSYPYCWAA